MALTINNATQDDTIILDVSGEVDLYTSPQLRKVIVKTVPKTKRLLAVNLTEVPYMDSSGVATLVEALKLCQAAKREFTLVAPSIPVMKVLELTKLDTVFTVREVL